MKIGILTWFFGNNYGARAHTYALRNVICKLGYECEFVNFIPKKGFLINILTNINAGNPVKHPIRTFRCLIRCVKFSIDKKLNPFGKKVFDGKELDLLGYDAIVIGSDAVLNIHHPQFETIYYGDGIEKTPFITYAPSSEYMKEGEMPDSHLENHISNAYALSARDNITKSILEKMTGRDVKKVLDPAFLYDFSDISKRIKEDHYLLIYSFSDWNQYSEMIKQYAKSNNLKIVSVGRYCSWANKSYDVISFKQWIGSFENADVVFTDSFHGVVFSVKNHKQMIVTARKDKEYKIRDLMDTLSIDNFQFFKGESVNEYLAKNRINYNFVSVSLEKMIKESLDYLKKSLYGACKER